MSTAATVAALIGSFVAMLIVSFSENQKKNLLIYQDKNNVLDDLFFFFVFSGGNIPVSLLSKDYEG